jgi:glucose dehydrogenase
MPAKNYAATRYSGLTQINAQNARSLHPLWTFSTGVLAGHEGQPLVAGETMYVVTPWPNVLYAFDLRKEGHPLRWKYRPDVSSNALGVACCDAVNRGAFYLDGRIVYNLLDGHTVAVDARSGRELWKTAIADMGNGETVTMAPVVVRDRVIVGASGGEFGIYGWLKGLDLRTGQIVWTGHNMGPDADMLARPDTFRPPYDGGVDVGAKSWAGDSWKTGGAPGSPTPPSSISSTTAPETRLPTTRRRGSATTSGARACWHAGQVPASWCGRISSRRMTTGTTTPPAPWSSSTSRSRASRSRRWCTSTRTASRTRWTAPRAGSW